MFGQINPQTCEGPSNAVALIASLLNFCCNVASGQSQVKSQALPRSNRSELARLTPRELNEVVGQYAGDHLVERI
jgi:hypothetical protein